MKQKNYRKVIIALIGVGVSHVALATDYSTMPTKELMQMSSQVRKLSSEEQNSFRNEMRNRMQSMSTEERSKFQQMNRQSSGSGSSYGQSNGGGGYGSGYGSRQGSGGRSR